MNFHLTTAASIYLQRRYSEGMMRDLSKARQECKKFIELMENNRQREGWTICLRTRSLPRHPLS
jgi:hypothetical protein